MTNHVYVEDSISSTSGCASKRFGQRCGYDRSDPIHTQPSTEGTQAAQPWEGHAYVPPDEWHGRWGCKVCAYSEDMHDVPAPVAQVDAGKPISTACKFGMCGDCDPNFPCDHECHGIEPAAAQTELPPIDWTRGECPTCKADFQIHNDWQRGYCQGLFRQSCEVASLTQRLQAAEAREAKLKAEIAKLQMDNVIDYKAACEQHAANYEALERSHKALKESTGRFLAYWETDFIKVTCADGRTLAELTGRMAADLAAAEKL